MNTQKKTTLHGNLMVIDQLGVCITGKHGIGKSELCLAMIDRGHSFISDDVIDVQLQRGSLMGSAPKASCGFLMLNGMGVINIQKIFGKNALAPKHKIHLIIKLVELKEIATIEDLLRPVIKPKTLLGVEMPEITFPAYAASNLPILIETLVRNFHLTLNGYDASTEFSNQLAREHHVEKEN